MVTLHDGPPAVVVGVPVIVPAPAVNVRPGGSVPVQLYALGDWVAVIV
jgi:hypothetical protein